MGLIKLLLDKNKTILIFSRQSLPVNKKMKINIKENSETNKKFVW